MRSEFQFLENAELCELKEKNLTKYLQHDARNTVKGESDRTIQVMQSDVNPHMAERIVDGRINRL